MKKRSNQYSKKKCQLQGNTFMEGWKIRRFRSVIVRKLKQAPENLIEGKRGKKSNWNRKTYISKTKCKSTVKKDKDINKNLHENIVKPCLVSLSAFGFVKNCIRHMIKCSCDFYFCLSLSHYDFIFYLWYVSFLRGWEGDSDWFFPIPFSKTSGAFLLLNWLVGFYIGLELRSGQLPTVWSSYP